jgi:hypothetical protein
LGEEKLMFVGRNPDGTIFGIWTVRQFLGQEEIADSSPEVIAFMSRTAIDQNDFQNLTKAFRAKCISDLAFRLNVLPSAITLAQIQAERTRIKNIADALP